MTRIERIRDILRDSNIPTPEIDRAADFIYSLSPVGIDGMLAVLSEIKEIRKSGG